MRELRCKNCGGFINAATYRCEYCGTQYESPSFYTEHSQRTPIIVKAGAAVDTIGCSVNVPYEMLKRESSVVVEDFVRRNMAEKIAHEISKNLVIDSETNPVRFERRYFTKLRVVKPNYKF